MARSLLRATCVVLCASIGCATAEADAPAVGGAPDSAAAPDVASHDSRADVGGEATPKDATLDDDVATEDTAEDATIIDDTFASADTGDTEEACVEPDSWSVPPWDTAVDETGCTKIWTRATAPGDSFGPDGLTMDENDEIQQGPLVGDFDLILETTDVIPPRGGATYGPILQMFATGCAGYSSAIIYLYSGFPTIYLHVTSTPSVDVGLYSKTFDYTVHINRSGMVVSATIDASDGRTITRTISGFSPNPISWDIHTDDNARMTLRKLTIVGGGPAVHSDDFTCNSIR